MIVAKNLADSSRFFGLCAIADDSPHWPRDPVEQAAAACRGGAAMIQLRAKRAGDREILRWGQEIRKLCLAHGALFFLNDRFDLALLCEADGVHLGQEDLSPLRLPEAARKKLRVGRSTHSLAEVRRARAEGVDYIALGPIFATTSKETPLSPCGLSSLAEAVRAAAPLPLIAIGGIDIQNAGAVAQAGATCVAVISAIAGAADPQAATESLVRAFRAGVRA